MDAMDDFLGVPPHRRTGSYDFPVVGARQDWAPLPSGDTPTDAERFYDADAEFGNGAEVASTSLARNSLGFFDAFAMTVAHVIGSGIFASPGIVLNECSGAVGTSLVIWVAAGLVSYIGFACLAELVAADPNAGGVYYYLRKVFGNAVAFAFTFINFFVIIPGSLAALALTFSQYTCSVVPTFWVGGDGGHRSGGGAGFEDTQGWGVKTLAAVCLAAATAVNCASAKGGGTVARAFACATLLGSAFVVLLGIVGVVSHHPGHRLLFIPS